MELGLGAGGRGRGKETEWVGGWFCRKIGLVRETGGGDCGKGVCMYGDCSD